MRAARGEPLAGAEVDSADSVTPPQFEMPQALVERARSLVGVPGVTSLPDGWRPAVPRDAATVVLVRDTRSGIEVFVQRRLRSMAFAAGMYVFPGGAVEQADRDAAAQLAELAADVVSSPTTMIVDGVVGEDTLAARIAAVRETEEEAGHRLPEPRTLAYIAHWITPEVEERRFDTRFYAAAVSAATELTDTCGESDKSLWISPGQALAQYAAREFAMLPPTVAVLSSFASAAAQGLDAQACVVQLAAAPVVPLLPAAVADPDSEHGVRWVLLDGRNGQEVAKLGGAPAGSESRGIGS